MDEPVARAVARDTLQSLLEFNHFPALYLHARWPAQLPHGDLVRKVLRLRPRSQALSRYLFGCFGISATASIDPQEAFHRILLRDHDSLQRTLARVGTLLKLHEVRGSIEGSLIRRRIKGVEPALLEQVAKHLDPLQGPLDEITRVGALRRGDLSRLHPEAVGRIVLASALGTESRALSRRLWMKLGPAFSRLHLAIKDRASASACRQLVAAFP